MFNSFVLYWFCILSCIHLESRVLSQAVSEEEEEEEETNQSITKKRKPLNSTSMLVSISDTQLRIEAIF
jgi:hypothetical protein